MRFEFATPTRIVFGVGSFEHLGPLTREFGQHALVVSGRSTQRAERAVRLLREQRIAATGFSVPSEPDIALVEQGVAVAREAHCDFVVGIGGGSALDAAKAIAALVTNDGHPTDYLEVVGRGRELARPSLPCVAVPTTAGTGSEVTRNAVLSSPTDRVKISLRSPFLLPRLAIVDAGLALSLPPATTAATGIDALTQVIEPYLSCRANPLSDALAVEGIRQAAGAIRTVFHDGSNVDARERMAAASLLGGMALANAALGAVHGFASPIGGMFDAPHGAVCAALLPHVMEGNVRALTARAGDHPVLRRFADVAALLTGRPRATVHDGIEWIRALVEELRIPRLHAYGIEPDDLPEIVRKSARASSMKGNPIELTAAERTEILLAAL